MGKTKAKAKPITLEQGYIKCVKCSTYMYLKTCDKNRSQLELQIKAKDKWISELLDKYEPEEEEDLGDLL